MTAIAPLGTLPICEFRANTFAQTYLQTLAGSQGFAGVTTQLTSRSLAAVVSAGASVAIAVQRAVGGTLASVTGALAGQGQLVRGGALDPFATLSRGKDTELSGALSVAGALALATARALGGTVAALGELPRLVVAASYAGAVGFSGVADRITSRLRTMTGDLTVTGALAQLSTRVISGVAAFAGAIAAGVTRTVALAAQLWQDEGGAPGAIASLPIGEADTRRWWMGQAGTLEGITARAFAGTGELTPSGNQSLLQSAVRAGVVGFNKAMTRLVALSGALSGSLAFVGDFVVSTTLRLRTLSGELWANPGAFAEAIGALPIAGWDAFRGWVLSVGELTRLTSRSVFGESAFDGALTRLRLVVHSAAVETAGAVGRAVVAVRDGALTLGGTIGSLVSRVVALAATLFVEAGAMPESIAALPIAALDAARGWAASVGELTRTTQRGLAAALQPQRVLSRFVAVAAQAALTVSGLTAAATTRTLSATLAFAGAVARAGVAVLAAAVAATGDLLGNLAGRFARSSTLTFVGIAGRVFVQDVAGAVATASAFTWSRFQRAIRFVRLGLRDIAQWRP